MKRVIISGRGSGMSKSTFTGLVVLMALCGGMLCRPAMAGHWEIDCKVASGETSNGNEINHAWEPSLLTGTDKLVDQSMWIGADDDKVMYRTYSPVLYWVSDLPPGETGPPDPPPDKVTVKITAQIEMLADANYNNNVVGAAPVISASCSIGQQGVPSTGYSEHDASSYAVSQGTIIRTYRTGGLYTVPLETKPTLKGSVQFSDENHVNLGLVSFSMFTYSCTIKINPDVTISSSVEPTYHKGADPLVPEINKPTPSGMMNADKAANWINPGEWFWSDTFHANLAGVWDNPQLQWSFGKGGNSYEDIPNGYVGYELGDTENDGPSSTTAGVKVVVTDNDGTTRMNTYNITFHAPYERWIQTGSHDIADQEYDSTVNGGITAEAGSSVNYDLNHREYLGAKEKEGADIISAVFEVSGAGVGLIEVIGSDGLSTPASLPLILSGVGALTHLATYTIGPPPPAAPFGTANASLQCFEDAVNKQVELDDEDPSIPYIFFNPPHLVNPVTQNYYTIWDVQKDPEYFFNGNVLEKPTGTLHAFTPMLHRDFSADHYTDQGYIGQQTAYNESPGSTDPAKAAPFYSFTWNYDSAPPTH